MTNRLSLIYTIAFMLATSVLIAQQKPVETQIAGFKKINFSELAQEELQQPVKMAVPPKVIQFRTAFRPGAIHSRPINGNVVSTDISTATSTDIITPNTVASSAPAASFSGIPDDGTIIPPDVMGAVGPKYLMETLNNYYKIYSKTGTSVLKLSPATFWAALGSYEGDPHLTYDSLSGRWIHCCIGHLPSGSYAIFVAVSETSDPTGNWFTYSINTGPSSTFPDYPLLGFNKRWIIITDNDFVNNGFNAVRIIVLNKSTLLSGTLGTVHTFFDHNNFTLSPAETLDNSQTTEYLLADYNGNNAGRGYVSITSITGTTTSPVYNTGALLSVNKPWSENEIDEPQKGSTQLIDAGDTRMGKTILRNGSLWATQTIFLPANSPTRSSVQWWQINPSKNSVVQLGRIDNGTGSRRFAFSSIAVGASNNVLIGFSLFGSTFYASAAYAYRSSSDSLNTMRAFYKYKAGGNVYYKTYGGSRNRWGDFSATCIDYTNGSFWTLQEFATSKANTWGTWWANVNVPTSAPVMAKNASVDLKVTMPSVSFNISPNPARELAVLRWQSTTQGTAMLSIINIQGTVVYSRQIPVTLGSNQLNIPLQQLNGGLYTVVLNNGKEISSTKLLIEK